MRPAGFRPAGSLLALAGVLFVAGRTSGAGWVVLLMCGLVAVVLVAAAWPAVTVARVAAEVLESPRDATAGTPAALTVAVTARGGALLARGELLGGTGPPVAVGPAGGRGRLTVAPGRRGVTGDAVVEVTGAAPLGLAAWRRRVRVPLPADIEVGPRPVELAPAEVAAAEPAGAGGSGPGRAGHETWRGVRGYLSGDPRRLVHWPATARWGELMVRETEDPAAPGVVIVVDLRGEPGRAEEAASRAAGLAVATLASGRPVTLNTAETAGPRSAPVTSAVEVGRRLARAVTDAAPAAASGPYVVRVAAGDPAAAPDLPRPGPAPASGARAGRGGGSLLDRVRRVNARQPAEESNAVRAAVLVAVLAAAAAVLDQQVGSGAFGLAVLVGIPGAFAYAWRTRHRPGLGTKLAVAAGSVVALAWFLHTLAGITGGTVADAQAPLAELLLAVQVLHALDATSRRDLLFSLFVSIVVMAAAGLLSVSMGLVPFLVVWSVAAVTALVLAHRAALAGVPSLAPPGAPAPRQAARRLGSGRPAAAVAAVLAAVLAVGTGLLFVVPPAGTARALTFPAALQKVVPIDAPGGLSNPSLGPADPGRALQYAAEARAGRRVAAVRSPFGYYGFSTFLDLGSRPRPDDSLVMRVRADRPAMWRAQTFDRWDGRTWTMSTQRSVTVRGQLPLDIPAPPGEENLPAGPEFVQSYYLVQPGPNLVFAAAPVSQVYVSERRVDELADGTLRSPVELGPGAVYTVVSRPPGATAATLRAADASPAGVPFYVARRWGYPLRATARVRRLAEQVTAAAPTTYDKVLALEAWMGAHTRYTLSPPPLPDGADAVDRFLFVDRRGFCEQIGTSLVVMLRSLGIPSRLAVGYASGLRNPFTGLFEVRASDAHAWAEVWFPGVGWEPFDPTAQVPLAGDAAESGAASGLGAYLSRVLPAVPAAPAGGLAGAAALAAAALAARRLARARRAARLRPAPSWAARAQRRLDRLGDAWGRPRLPGDTLGEFVAALRASAPEGEDLERAAEVVDRSAFGPEPPAAEDTAWVDAFLDRLESPAPRGGVSPRA